MNLSSLLVHSLLELIVADGSNLFLDLFVDAAEILETELTSLLALLARLTLLVEFGPFAVETDNVLLNALFFQI